MVHQVGFMFIIALVKGFGKSFQKVNFSELDVREDQTTQIREDFWESTKIKEIIIRCLYTCMKMQVKDYGLLIELD